MSQTNSISESNVALERTRSAYMWTSILNAPFWAIFNMLPFILYKDLHASPLQITAIVIVKPAVSLFSLYWSSLINKRKDRLLGNLVWARFLGHVPFFFFPFISNPWFFIAAFGLYMTLARGTIPAWMEILKLNIPGVSRERIFAYGSAFSYIGSGILPFALGWIMDAHFQAWRWIFPATAFFSLAAVIFTYRIPISLDAFSSAKPSALISWRQQLLQPWKNMWTLLRERPDFARYQVGFMLGGSGLIVMQPALPVFFVDVLNLSYTELVVALTLCKGIGFAVTSQVWAQFMNRVDIYRFNSWVTFLACLFPLFLITSQHYLACLYVGYLVYGVMQAGSEMSWNLSGPLFAKEEDSTVYSSVNVLTVGLRGCCVPAIGSLLCCWTNSVVVMLIGGVLCILATLRMTTYSRRASATTPSAA
jgi:Major Facilitator Superfamily